MGGIPTGCTRAAPAAATFDPVALASRDTAESARRRVDRPPETDACNTETLLAHRPGIGPMPAHSVKTLRAGAWTGATTAAGTAGIQATYGPAHTLDDGTGCTQLRRRQTVNLQTTRSGAPKPPVQHPLRVDALLN